MENYQMFEVQIRTSNEKSQKMVGEKIDRRLQDNKAYSFSNMVSIVRSA